MHLYLCRIAIVAAALCFLGYIHGGSHDTVASSVSRTALKAVVSDETLQDLPQICTLRQYVPSAWENEWVANADDLAAKETICSTMQASADLVDKWLTSLAACKQGTSNCWSALPDRIFSKFVKECKPARKANRFTAGGRGVLVEEHIEPLVGHMRHPQSLQACVPASGRSVDIQDRDYIMLQGDSPTAIRARYPGRSILVDAGTNTYGSSLGYLIPAYARLGIHFDAVYAWEATPANAAEYWASVPDDVKPRLHFYNAPVTPEPGSAMNPVDWIRDMHRPGDYIVFKLDIDNDVVESKLVQQVLALENAGDVIAEMFFEKHYAAADMTMYFGAPETRYPEALRLMHELRTKGVRAHYWP